MNIETQLNSIESKKILVIGDVMLDKYIFGESNRLSPEAPVPILRKTRETMVLGGHQMLQETWQKRSKMFR